MTDDDTERGRQTIASNYVGIQHACSHSEITKKHQEIVRQTHGTETQGEQKQTDRQTN